MVLRRVPCWVWFIEAAGILLTFVAWSQSGFLQSWLLVVGTALLLALPLALVQQRLEQSLTATVAAAVTSSIQVAEGVRLSRDDLVPKVPEELELWPFKASAVASLNGQIELRLTSVSSIAESYEPLDVMIVVTRPTGATAATERRLNSWAGGELLQTVGHEITSWRWPDDFTSEPFKPEGRHRAVFYVCPISVGPSRRFGEAAAVDFDYRNPN